MLAEHHGIILSVESVRTLMRSAGLWRARRRRLKPIHPMRERRPRRGELIQIDGSRSEEHPSELQSLMRITYAVFGLQTKKKPETTSELESLIQITSTD